MMEPTLKLETHGSTTVRTVSPGPPIDWQYFKSIPGILKLIELLLGILTIALATPGVVNWTYFFLLVCYVCLFLTLFFALVYFFSLHHKVTVRPSWISMEFYYTVGATFFYGIITIIQFSTYDHSMSTGVVAAVFALLNTIAYGAGLYFIFTEWRHWRNTRGAIPVSRG